MKLDILYFTIVLSICFSSCSSNEIESKDKTNILIATENLKRTNNNIKKDCEYVLDSYHQLVIGEKVSGNDSILLDSRLMDTSSMYIPPSRYTHTPFAPYYKEQTIDDDTQMFSITEQPKETSEPTNTSVVLDVSSDDDRYSSCSPLMMRFDDDTGYISDE
jgi:hypothetical protein